jgi:hypothetical protein
LQTFVANLKAGYLRRIFSAVENGRKILQAVNPRLKLYHASDVGNIIADYYRYIL